jgi:hypothetical protein
MNNEIPLYSPDGELIDWIRQKRMDRLIAAEMVMVVRTRKGEIRRLVLRRGADDPTPNSIADYIGTRYSFQERLDDGRRVWTLRRLGKRDELRSLFAGVMTERMAQA